MNRKSTSNNLRAPTSQPANSIAPSATLAMDGDLPVSASNGVSAPEPLASHDVLHAALAPHPGDTLNGNSTSGTDTAVVDEAPAAQAAEPDAPGVGAKKGDGKKSAKKPAKVVATGTDEAPAAAPVKPIKVPKIKFVEVTFALPESEAALLDAMKKTHQANGLALKKSQLLRAGLLALADIDADRLAQLVAHLPVEPRARKKKK